MSVRPSITERVRQLGGGHTAGAIQVVIAALIAQAGGFASGLLLARGLTASTRGVLAVVLLWPVTISSLVSTGLLQAVNFRAASNRDSVVRTGIGAALRLAIALVTPAAIGLFFLLPSLVGSQAGFEARVYLVWMPLSVLSGILAIRLLGEDEVQSYTAARVVSVFLSLVSVAVLFAVGQLTVHNIVLGYILAEVGTAAFAYVRLRKHLTEVEEDAGEIRALASYAARSTPGAAASVIGDRADQLVLAQSLAPAALGTYVVAGTFAGVAGLVGQSVADLVLSRVARRSPSRGSIFRFASIAFALGIAGAAAVAVLASFAVGHLLGTSYSSAVVVIRVLAIHFAVLGTIRLFSGVLRGLGRPGWVASADLATTAVRFAALLVLVPLYGVTGAAVAVLVSSALNLTIHIEMTRRATQRELVI